MSAPAIKALLPRSDRRNHRLAEVFDQVQHTLPEPAGLFGFVGAEMLKFTDVRSGNKGLVAPIGSPQSPACRGFRSGPAHPARTCWTLRLRRRRDAQVH